VIFSQPPCPDPHLQREIQHESTTSVFVNKCRETDGRRNTQPELNFPGSSRARKPTPAGHPRGRRFAGAGWAPRHLRGRPVPNLRFKGFFCNKPHPGPTGSSRCFSILTAGDPDVDPPFWAAPLRCRCRDRILSHTPPLQAAGIDAQLDSSAMTLSARPGKFHVEVGRACCRCSRRA